MKCWSCGKTDMVKSTELGAGWLICPLCGTTWVKMPKLGVSALGGIEVKSKGVGRSTIRGYKSKKARKE